ncbi:MAG: DNA-binding protein, partial [Burkholderiales bacterium]|nr:DNA-binding protein [Burkholderiales bacterium]
MPKRKPYPTLIPLRLMPGDDLKQVLEAFAAARRLRAAFVIVGIGSLDGARIRHAGRTRASTIRGELEILSLSGSLCGDGAHLHAMVADDKGRTRGGHVADGCRIRTTAEILIAVIPHAVFRRV